MKRQGWNDRRRQQPDGERACPPSSLINGSQSVCLQSGFTMIELLVVLAVITLLLALSLPAVTKAREAAKRAQCMNNLRNIALALMQFEHVYQRFPASGNFYDPPFGSGGAHHSWAIPILPFLDQSNLYQQWDLDQPFLSDQNEPLTHAYIPVYLCPADISRNEEKGGDLSYVVNGGWGMTIRTSDGVGDCPHSINGHRLDLNGDGQTCIGDSAIDNQDRDIYKAVGLFFMENWKVGGTVRHHSVATVTDGTTQTFLVGENVRTGFDPGDSKASFAAPFPNKTSFFVGVPCRNWTCAAGNVDYSVCNAGEHRINSGLWSAEGASAVLNSFHAGGVVMSYVDGHVKFLSENIDGRTYAALASPQGASLEGGPLAQGIIAGGVY